MEDDPTAAVLVSCGDCGLVRVAGDYASGQARGQAHRAVTGHRQVHYALIDAPEGIKVAQAFEAWSEKLVRDDIDESVSRLTSSGPPAAAQSTLPSGLDDCRSACWRATLGSSS